MNWKWRALIVAASMVLWSISLTSTLSAQDLEVTITRNASNLKTLRYKTGPGILDYREYRILAHCSVPCGMQTLRIREVRNYYAMLKESQSASGNTIMDTPPLTSDGLQPFSTRSALSGTVKLYQPSIGSSSPSASSSLDLLTPQLIGILGSTSLDMSSLLEW